MIIMEQKYDKFNYINKSTFLADLLNGIIPNDAIAFILETNEIWTHNVFYALKEDLSNLITNELFAPVSVAAYNSISKGTLSTLNGLSLENGENITLDMSLYMIVETLPTEDISDNKIYMVPVTTNNQTGFAEYIWTGTKWNQLGVYTATVDLSGYLKSSDADNKYMPKSSTNPNTNSVSLLSISSTGAFNNFGNNGQAFNAVRDFSFEPNNTKWNSALGTGYKIDAASFGVKDNGTTAFSHKKYDTFNKENGTYTGAKNTAVLVFSGKTGLMYAKNTGSANDVTDAMYKYIGVIDSPDENQKVYSATLVDNLINKIKAVLTELGATEEQINSINI